MNNSSTAPESAKRKICHCGRDVSDRGRELCDVCIVVDDVMDSFGEVLVRHFPNGRSGDLSPHRTIRLVHAIEEATVEWIDNNVTDATHESAS